MSVKKSKIKRGKMEEQVHKSQVQPRIDLASEMDWEDGRRFVRVVIYQDGAPTYLDLGVEEAEKLGVRLVKESYRCAVLWGRGPDRDPAGI